jgi:hypothetical protein
MVGGVLGDPPLRVPPVRIRQEALGCQPRLKRVRAILNILPFKKAFTNPPAHATILISLIRETQQFIRPNPSLKVWFKILPGH